MQPAPPGLRRFVRCGSGCEGHAQGLAEVLPYRDAKAERPTRRGVAFVALRDDGAVLLRERPLKGLLGGMLETPSSPWTERGEKAEPRSIMRRSRRNGAKCRGSSSTPSRISTWSFQSISPRFQPKRSSNAAAHPERCRWVHVRDLHSAALPSLMRKVLAHALEEKRARPQARAAARAASRKASIGLSVPSAS